MHRFFLDLNMQGESPVQYLFWKTGNETDFPRLLSSNGWDKNSQELVDFHGLFYQWWPVWRKNQKPGVTGTFDKSRTISSNCCQRLEASKETLIFRSTTRACCRARYIWIYKELAVAWLVFWWHTSVEPDNESQVVMTKWLGWRIKDGRESIAGTTPYAALRSYRFTWCFTVNGYI